MQRLFSLPAPFCLVISLCLFSACGSSRDLLPVAEIQQGDWKEIITLPEFERRYTENNKTIETAKMDSLAQYREFLERYIDFRLKVKNANDEGFADKPELKMELAQYRLSMAPAYLTEKEVLESAVKSMYERRQEDVSAAHILIRLAPDALPEDTLKAFNKISDIKTEVLANKTSFDSAAVRFSEDPSAQQNYGNLGYFTAGMMVYQFEDACYDGKKGEIIGPIRTRFGYHLIKIIDKRKREQAFVSHIMAFCQPQSSPTDTMNAYNKILDAQARLNQGEKFEELARDISDDRQSATNGGSLGAIGRGQIPVPEFDQAVFALKNVGDLSPIIRTQYGYHIIKLDYKGFKSLDEERENIKTMLKRNPEKMNAEDDKLIARLKQNVQYQETLANAMVIVKKSDSAATFLQIDSLNFSPQEKSSIVFSFNNRAYSLDSLIGYLKANNIGTPITKSSVEEQVKAYAKQELKNYEISQLDARYPEFARLMNDYRDGILLFNISEKKVWSPAIPNDSVGKLYYAANQSRYQYGERVSVSQIVVSNKETADKLYAELTKNERTLDVMTEKDVKTQTADLNKQLARLKKKEKNYPQQRDELLARRAALKVDTRARSFEELSKQYGQKFDDSDSLKSGFLGKFQKGENKTADVVFTQAKGYLHPPTQLDGAFVIIRVDGKEAPRPKTFEEARPEVYSQYQEETAKRLESQWLSSLRAKTVIAINEDNLQKAFRFAVEAAKPSANASAATSADGKN